MADATEMDLQQNAEINNLWKKVDHIQMQTDGLTERVDRIDKKITELAHMAAEMHEQVEPLETIKHHLEKLHDLMSKLK